MSNAYLEQLPQFYSNIREFKEISQIISKDWSLLDDSLELVAAEQFILTASEKNITRRELEFEILADPTLESLEFRRKRLISRISERNPLVFRRFIETLDLILEGGLFDAKLDTDLFELELILFNKSFAKFAEVINLVERLVPLNIYVSFIARLEESQHMGAATSAGETVSVIPKVVTHLKDRKNSNYGLVAFTGEVVTVFPYELTNLDITSAYQDNVMQEVSAESSTLYPTLVSNLDVKISSTHTNTVISAELVRILPN